MMGDDEAAGGGGGASLRGRGLSLDDIVVVTCEVTVTTEDNLQYSTEDVKRGGALEMTNRLGVVYVAGA